MSRLSRNAALSVGILAVAAVLLPPLSSASAQLTSAHMMQHLLLILVAAPLLVASGATGHRRLAGPVTAWIAFVAVFLFWHWPAAFRWAAEMEGTRLLEHFSILAGAILFWKSAFSPNLMSHGARALFVLTAAVATDLPGVIMVFSPHAICAMPGESAGLWGLTPLEDQQLAGMLMWVPANLVFFGIATALFWHWLSNDKPESTAPSRDEWVTS